MAFCRGMWTSIMPGQPPYVHNCECECHATITEMYQIAGRERVWPETGKWWKEDDPDLPEVPKFSGPWNDPSWYANKTDNKRHVTASQVEARRAADGELTPDEKRVRKAIEHGMLPPNTDYVAEVKAVTASEDDLKKEAILAMGLTPKANLAEAGESAGKTGTRRSGQLEYEVKKICDKWALGLMPHVLTLTCSEIAKAINPSKPPSTGAITNVLLRWHEIGFAFHRSGPHRFEGYTPEGIKYGPMVLQDKFMRGRRTATRPSGLAAMRSKDSK